MITNINDFKKAINENLNDKDIANKDNAYKLYFHLNSPYLWGKGWTGSDEQLVELENLSIAMLEELGLTLRVNQYGVEEGDGSGNIFNAYMHPMEFVFYLKENNKEDIEKIKNTIIKYLENISFSISFSSIKLKSPTGEYSTIQESINESFHDKDGKPISVDSKHRPIKLADTFYNKTVTRKSDGLIGDVVRIEGGKLQVKVTDGENEDKIFIAYPDEVTINENFDEDDGNQLMYHEIGWDEIKSKLIENTNDNMIALNIFNFIKNEIENNYRVLENKKVNESSYIFSIIDDKLEELGFKPDDIQPPDPDVGIFDGYVSFSDPNDQNKDGYYLFPYDEFVYSNNLDHITREYLLSKSEYRED